MNALELLKADHKKLKKILDTIAKTTSRTAKKREALLLKAKEELMIHEKIEEQLVYPIFKEANITHELALEAYEEHHFANVILKEVEETSVEDETWKAKFSVFKENINHHIKEEEGELFKLAKKILNRNELIELGKQIQKFKRELKKSKRLRA